MREWLKKLWPYLMLAGIVALHYAFFRSVNTLHQRGKYTVGRLGGWVQGIKGGRSFDYHYAVNGKNYRGSFTEEHGMNTSKGAYYLVEFDSIEPKTSAGYVNHPLPATVEAPPGGWNKKAYKARERADVAQARADSLRNAPAAEAAKQQADAARYKQQLQQWRDENK